MNFISKLFIDGGDPQETKKANALLKTKKPEWKRGIEGQTTNPTLVAKNPDIQKYLASGKKLSTKELLAEYKKIVENVAKVTSGPISIQVIGDHTTSSDDLLSQARVYQEWIPNGVVKFPCTTSGLTAAEIFCREGSVNITLNFSQSQAAAVYKATQQRGISPDGTPYQVFISPFVGRLDDRGENGMDVVGNILEMYRGAVNPEYEAGLKCHVDVLTASVRSVDHILYAIKLDSPAITIPFKLFQEWADKDFVLPDENFIYHRSDLKPITYQELSLDQPWQEYDLHHDLTDSGLARFMDDWQALLK